METDTPVTQEPDTEPELEFDVIENSQPQPRVFMYDAKIPNEETKRIAVISFNGTDARDGLLSRLAQGTTLTRVGVVADYIVQV